MVPSFPRANVCSHPDEILFKHCENTVPETIKNKKRKRFFIAN
jgi:hypothetical protein